jgi:hypothetical protein
MTPRKRSLAGSMGALPLPPKIAKPPAPRVAKPLLAAPPRPTASVPHPPQPNQPIGGTKGRASVAGRLGSIMRKKPR